MNAVKQPTPLKRLALHTTTTCASQATVYAKCIVANYTDVSKDLCKDQFLLFRDCVREAVRLQFMLKCDTNQLVDEETVLNVCIGRSLG